MSLTERRNTAAGELAALVEAEENLISREGFDPDAEQYTELVSQRESKEAELIRMDRVLDAGGRTTPREDRRPGTDWATTLIRERLAGKPSRMVEVPIDRAYHVVQSAEPYLKADTVTLRPTPPAATFPTPVIDAATNVSVSSNAYRYVTLPPIVSAGTVAENAAKLGVEFTSAEVSGTLTKWAHILDVTQETLEDEPQAQQILSQWLMAGVNRAIEAAAAGVVTAGSGYLTAATAAGGNAAQAIRLGVATLQAAGLTANAAMINPTDWANLDLYMFGAAGSNSQSVIQSNPWGVRLIAVNSVAAGTVFVGDFKAGLLHIQRSTVAVDITDSGQSVETVPRDRFTHNLYGLRAEARAKTVLQQPKAIVKATITP